MLYWFIKFTLMPILRLIYLISVEGKENEPETAYIACANHSSFVDPLLLAVALKRQQRFVARSTLIRFKFFEWIFNKGGVITIKRGKSDVAAVRAIIKSIKEGDCVGIFPQGTRKKGLIPVPKQAEAGLGLIAASTEVPVLPVSIVTKRLKPGIFRRTRIIIGKPIFASEYMNFIENPRKKEIAEYCFSFVCKPFGSENND